VKIYKDAAIVAGLCQMGFRSLRIGSIIKERRYTHTYVKQKGRWQIASQQVSSNLYKGRQPRKEQVFPATGGRTIQWTRMARYDDFLIALSV